VGAHRLWLIDEKENKHSIAALCGALEVSPAVAEWEIDFARRGNLLELLRAARPARRPEVLGYSFCTARAPDVAASLLELRRAARRWRRRPYLVAGGPHASGDPAGTLTLGFDGVVVGEGEAALPALLARLGRGRDPRDAPGLAWLDNGRVRRNRRPRPVDLDRYPPFSARHRRYAATEISRGCPHACRFCQSTGLMGRRMRHRSLDAVIAAVERGRACGLRHQRFVSTSALAYGSADGRTPELKAVEVLLREAARVFGRGSVFFGTFPSEVRPETVSAEALALITRFTATERIVIGLQTGSDRLLEELHRGHTAAEVVRAVELIRGAGLEPVVDLIFGLPGETAADRRVTAALAERLVGLGARLHGHTFMPLPGSALGHSPPGRLDPETRQLANLLASRGQLFGKWQTQERIASQGT